MRRDILAKLMELGARLQAEAVGHITAEELQAIVFDTPVNERAQDHVRTCGQCRHWVEHERRVNPVLASRR